MGRRKGRRELGKVGEVGEGKEKGAKGRRKGRREGRVDEEDGCCVSLALQAS